MAETDSASWPILIARARPLVCLVFYLARPQADRNYGGMTSGFRWMFWFAPLWLVALLPAADRLAASRAGPRLGAGAAGALGDVGQLSDLESLDASLAVESVFVPGLEVGLSRTSTGVHATASPCGCSCQSLPRLSPTGRFNDDLFARRGMEELQRPRVQRDRPQPLVVVLTAQRNLRAVVRIAQHGISARGGLHANLVRAAGLAARFPATSRRGEIRACDSAESLPDPPGCACVDDRGARLSVDLVQVIGPGAAGGSTIRSTQAQ